MSIHDRLKNSKVAEFWLLYEQKIILAVGIVLIAAISFEAGFLHGQKNKQESVIVNKVAAADISKTEPGQKNANTSSAKTIFENSKFAPLESTAAINSQKCAFVASKNSNKFHLPTCRYAQNIKSENKVCFSSKEEAESRGFQGAKCCVK